MRRRELERRHEKIEEWRMREALEKREPSEKLKRTATEKIRTDLMDKWVNRLYEPIKNPDLLTPKEIKRLVEWDWKRIAIEDIMVDKGADAEPQEPLDEDLSSEEVVSSEGSEGDLRRKIVNYGSKIRKPDMDKEKRIEGKKLTPALRHREGVTGKLKDFYIHDLQEMKSLAYDEELYVFHPSGNVMGSWRVNVRVCEDDERFVNVQFEGLLARSKANDCMYTSGIVDRCYCPVTEFRIEEKNDGDYGNASKRMFFHKKGRNWHFDVRRGENEMETSKTFKLGYNQMLNVVSESAHILLMRKIVMYRYPVNFNEDISSPDAPCDPNKHEDKSIFPKRKKFVLQMRTLSIEGQLCRTNYRFYPPTKVRFHRQDLDVVRVRRRVEMPGHLVQTSNYYVTTAGQLVAITFNDPYPYDTPYYLQIDPKAVLDPTRVIPPERIVPLRERYMFDPELKQYYQLEVQRLEKLNRTYLKNRTSVQDALTAVSLELLADKPHRVMEYVNGFFVNTFDWAQTWR